MVIAILLLGAAAAGPVVQTVDPAATPPATQVAAVEEPNPSFMSREEIRAFNATVGDGHPYYIRCRRDIEIGTLAKARTVCRTARQWAEADYAGNRAARDTLRMLDETRGQVRN